MLVPLERVASFPFSTRNPYTGAAQHADAPPTCAVYQAGATIPMAAFTAVVATEVAAIGQYVLSLDVSAANGFSKETDYTIRASAIVETVSDEAPIAAFRVGREIQGDDSLRALTVNDQIAMAAAGAGAGEVDTGAAVGTTRNETFKYTDGTEAFTVTADANGNRTQVTYP